MLRVCCCLLLLLFSSASFAQYELTSAEIRAIQSALEERGYDPGPVDGDYGRRTAEAIRNFEQASGLPVTGSAGLTIRQRLKAIFPEIVAQYSKAAELTFAEIQAIQTALKERGYDPGPVDGAYGRRMAEAIRGFEQASGLPVSGSVSLTIQRRLNAIIPETVARHREAARLGHASAQNSLGEIYANGSGVEKDEAEAVAWYRKAAGQGHASAQNSLGEMYAKGRGVEKDEAEAVAWYSKAAEQGHAWAQYRVGEVYDKGRGVPQDDGEAVVWYRKAAEQGHVWAQYSLGKVYDKGRGVEKDKAEAVAWYRKAAEQGNDWAQYSLGNMYDKGRGVPQDDGKAVAWYRKAAEQGNDWAQYSLGGMYDKGRGVPQDGVRAHMWFHLAAAQGHEQAQQSRDIAAKGMSPGQIDEAGRMTREWLTQHPQ